MFLFPFAKMVFVARVLSKESLLLGYTELKVGVGMGVETRQRVTHLSPDSNTYTVPWQQGQEDTLPSPCIL